MTHGTKTNMPPSDANLFARVASRVRSGLRSRSRSGDSNKAGKSPRGAAIIAIVKVQRPLFPKGQVECLVYDEKNFFVVQQIINDEAMSAMKKRIGIQQLKAYFEAEWDGESRVWLLGKLVDDQKW